MLYHNTITCYTDTAPEFSHLTCPTSPARAGAAPLGAHTAAATTQTGEHCVSVFGVGAQRLRPGEPWRWRVSDTRQANTGGEAHRHRPRPPGAAHPARGVSLQPPEGRRNHPGRSRLSGMATADPAKLTAEDRRRILDELAAQQARQRQHRSPS